MERATELCEWDQEIPEAQLRSGKGLVGFGIVADPDVGKTIFDRMSHLEPGMLKLLDVFPLKKAEAVPLPPEPSSR